MSSVRATPICSPAATTAWTGSCSPPTCRCAIPPGGFRVWWRPLARRPRCRAGQHPPDAPGRPVLPARAGLARAGSNDVPVIDCTRDERKQWIAEEYLREHPVGPAQRQAAQAGIGVTPLAAGSNSFASTTDPAGLQAICDRLGPSTITVFAERWWARLPLPLTTADRKAGYWWYLSMRQVEVSRTLVFDQPANGRLFFDALVTDNLDVGRPDQIELIFGRRVLPSTTGVFATRVVTRGVDVTVNAFYRHSRVKQYHIISSRSFGVLVLQGVGRWRHVLDAPLAGEAGGHSLALTRWSRRSPSSRATCSCRWVLSVRSRALSSSSVSTRRWRDSSEPRCVAGGRGRLAGACPVRSRSISARRSGCR